MKAISTRNWTGSLVAGFLLLALFFAGCSCGPEADVSPPADIPLPTSTPSPPELDTSLLTDDPCRAPCWHNIIPGVSGEDDVRAQLQDSPFVKEGTLEYELTEWREVQLGMFYWQGRGEHYNRVYLRDGKVLRIEIRIDHDWTLGEAVDKFGPPKGVLADTYGVETTGYHVDFYYPAQGLIFESNMLPVDRQVYLGDGKGILQKDLKVTQATYFAPTSLEGMISEVYLYSPDDDMEGWLANIHEWQGFGEVELAR
ncbi:MAG: hypothetical protein JW918_04765 [Anaerolineae bacterium]|nr:hypothetical protein [Anaerolineae bacterium]